MTLDPKAVEAAWSYLVAQCDRTASDDLDPVYWRSIVLEEGISRDDVSAIITAFIAHIEPKLRERVEALRWASIEFGTTEEGSISEERTLPEDVCRTHQPLRPVRTGGGMMTIDKAPQFAAADAALKALAYGSPVEVRVTMTDDAEPPWQGFVRPYADRWFALSGRRDSDWAAPLPSADSIARIDYADAEKRATSAPFYVREEGE